MIGAYHSHPQSAPVPSPTDIAEAVSDAFLYVIVSCSQTHMRGRREPTGFGTADSTRSAPTSSDGDLAVVAADVAQARPTRMVVWPVPTTLFFCFSRNMT